MIPPSERIKRKERYSDIRKMSQLLLGKTFRVNANMVVI